MDLSERVDDPQSGWWERIFTTAAFGFAACSAAVLIAPEWWRNIIFVAASIFSLIVFFIFRGGNHSLAFGVLGGVFGFCAPLVSTFSSGSLLVIESLVLIPIGFFVPIRISWAAPWLIVLAGSCFADLYWTFDLQQIVASLRSMAHAEDVIKGVAQAPPVALLSFVAVSRWLLMVVVFDIACKSRPFVISFCSFLAIGLLCSLAALSYQAIYNLHSFNQAQQAYWSSLHRFAATFTDPNAFAVVAFLALGFLTFPSRDRLSDSHMLCAAKRWHDWKIPSTKNFVFIVFTLVALLTSGSRTLVLGVSLFTLSFARLRRRTVVMALITMIACYGLFSQLSLPELEKLTDRLPESVTRVLETIHPQSAKSALFSRHAFAQVNLAVWRNNPLFGVGLDRFSHYLPIYAHREGLDLGLWTDNSNNFYLGVLSELGVVGLVALFSSVILLRRTSPHIRGAQSHRAERICYIFLALLFLGPHITFDETAILAGVVLAIAGWRVAYTHSRWLLGLFAFVFIVLIVPLRQFANQGLFPLEQGVEGRYRWTGQSARFWLECSSQGVSQLTLKAANVDLSQRPLQVTIRTQDNLRVLSLSDNQRRDEVFPCDRNQHRGAFVILEIDRSFIPNSTHNNGDFRSLGIQLFSPVI